MIHLFQTKPNVSLYVGCNILLDDNLNVFILEDMIILPDITDT